MQSAIYRGWLRHRRFHPRDHQFRYRLSLFCLDIDELDWLVCNHRLLGSSRWLPIRFHRSDYLDGHLPEDKAISLREAVDRRLGSVDLPASQGPVRLLTQPRYFGHGFNPVSFYYVYDRYGRQVEAIIAEITNTPWKERHSYVFGREESCHPLDSRFRFLFDKRFHVSPFMPMEMEYDWRFSEPGEDLNVHMRLDRGSVKQFDATLSLQRQPLTPANLRRVALSQPLQSLKVVADIHWQALRLWLKRVPVHNHPSKSNDKPKVDL